MAVIWASVLYVFVFEIAKNYYFLIKKLIKIVQKKIIQCNKRNYIQNFSSVLFVSLNHLCSIN